MLASDPISLAKPSISSVRASATLSPCIAFMMRLISTSEPTGHCAISRAFSRALGRSSSSGYTRVAIPYSSALAAPKNSAVNSSSAACL